MPTIGTVSRPAYVYDQETDTWVPVGVGPHTHENFITSTTIDAKGDLLVGLSPDTVDRLGVGANGTFLVADSTETLGMAWRNIIPATNSTTVPLTLKGSVGQTANLINLVDSSNNFLFSVLPTGRIEFNTVGTFLFQGTAYRASNPASIVGRRSRSDTFGVNAALQINDGVTNIQAQANDGTTFLQSSAIFFEIDAAVSTNIVPGRMIFSTASNTGAGMAERMRIDSSGRVQIPAGGVLEAPLTTRSVSGTTDSLVLADAGKLIEYSNTGAITVTVPTNTSIPFPTGTQVNILQTNTGQVSIVGAGGVTINSTPGPKLRTQWSYATLIKRATDTWVLVGDIVA